MSAMRAYALYERNRVLHVYLVTFVLGGFCIGCVSGVSSIVFDMTLINFNPVANTLSSIYRH